MMASEYPQNEDLIEGQGNTSPNQSSDEVSFAEQLEQLLEAHDYELPQPGDIRVGFFQAEDGIRDKAT